MTISSPIAHLTRSALTPPSLLAALAALAASACASDDLPETRLGNTSDLLVEAVASVPERIPVATAAEGIDPFLLGDWVGRAEDLFSASNADGSRPEYVFPSGSSEIFLHLDLPRDDDGNSHIRFGQREAPVPEPGIAYGDVNYYTADIFRLVGSPSYSPVEGVAYPLWRQALLLSGKDYPALGFSFSPEAAFSEWCPLQPPQPTGADSFNCSGATGFGGGDPEAGVPCTATLADGSQRAIDCDFVVLCSLACECDETSCQPQFNEPLNELWIAREGDELIGHLSRAVFEHGLPRPMPIGTIRFERVMP